MVRSLVVHADDFGMNPAVNAGIIRGFRDGCLTATSLLANAPAFDAAITAWHALRADQGRTQNQRRSDWNRPFELGIHFNLTQGRPLTAGYPRALCDAAGRFPGIGGLYARLVRYGRRYRAEIRAELAAQLDRALTAVPDLTHANGHQYVELLPVVAGVVLELLESRGLRACRLAAESRLQAVTRHPLKVVKGLAQQWHALRVRAKLAAHRLTAPDQFHGSTTAGAIDNPVVWQRFLRTAQTGSCTEIAVHPGELPDATTGPTALEIADGWADPLATNRERELAWLCSPDALAMINDAGLHLGRFADLLTSQVERARATA